MLEVKISIADNEIIAYRSLEDEELVPGEKNKCTNLSFVSL